jgi:N-acetylmuramoyl-L-alanine amidase
MSLNKPDKVILHCAATPDYIETDPLFDRFGAKEITEWHIERGFQTIGYHWIVRRTGVIEKGRDEREIGAHCLGQNSQSIGVVYVGTAEPTAQQIESLRHLAKQIIREHRIPIEKWYPHHHFNAGKDCPNLSKEKIMMLLDNLDNTW